jgi:hypothetical protein
MSEANIVNKDNKNTIYIKEILSVLSLKQICETVIMELNRKNDNESRKALQEIAVMAIRAISQY